MFFRKWTHLFVASVLFAWLVVGPLHHAGHDSHTKNCEVCFHLDHQSAAQPPSVGFYFEQPLNTDAILVSTTRLSASSFLIDHYPRRGPPAHSSI